MTVLTASTSRLLRLSPASCSSSSQLFTSLCCLAPSPLSVGLFFSTLLPLFRSFSSSFFLSLVARFSLLPRAEEEEEEDDAPLSDRRTRRGSPMQGGSGVEDAIANIDERCTCRT